MALPAPATPTATVEEHVRTLSEVVLTAMGYLDKPYRYGGHSMNEGFDCSGFVVSLFQRATGQTLPRTAAEQARATRTINKQELIPGDLVFFNTMRRQYSHVGIYVGDGRFIHSPRAGSKIRVERMDTSYWQKRFNGARRVVAAEG
ncbi:NlpC/P60 family protein [Corticibacter populi]|uniref:NlpC/P60 family protein n=1 Tax=Corticibacter populi TaxID=1550736 RepID=A0A3M6R2D1_9BURK|nr:C40 family peptidase [Corticibacter populi]RMX08902.1 NlpC/P60 family protein [Corticibacter populi]